VREIPLTQGKIALVDDEDYADLAQFKWRVQPSGRTFYAVRHDDSKKKRTTERMHRRILKVQVSEEVDHINHNGLDCQKHNLRKCTQLQNNANQQKQLRKSVDGFKGIIWVEWIKKWRARIRHNGKLIHLGYFDKDVLAARAYDSAAREHFGEFASTNFSE
jgi:hypothetical protein